MRRDGNGEPRVRDVQDPLETRATFYKLFPHSLRALRSLRFMQLLFPLSLTACARPAAPSVPAAEPQALLFSYFPRNGDTYYLVMRDENFFPAPTRNLRVATAKRATGPYGPAGPAFTARDTEGPSILHVGEWWYVYFDYYTRGRYGSRRTKDLVNWEIVSDSLHAPRGIRHGSAFLAPESVLRGLIALDSAARQ